MTNKKEFNDKTELIEYIKNYIEYKIGIPVNEKLSIDELLHIYFNGYERIK